MKGARTARKSRALRARSIHSRVWSARWVLAGIAERSGSHASKVLPAGSPDARRRIGSSPCHGRRPPRRAARAEPRRVPSAASGRVRDHLRRRSADVWKPQAAQQASSSSGSGGGWRCGDRSSPESLPAAGRALQMTVLASGEQISSAHRSAAGGRGSAARSPSANRPASAHVRSAWLTSIGPVELCRGRPPRPSCAAHAARRRPQP